MSANHRRITFCLVPESVLKEKVPSRYANTKLFSLAEGTEDFEFYKNLRQSDAIMTVDFDLIDTSLLIKKEIDKSDDGSEWKAVSIENF